MQALGECVKQHPMSKSYGSVRFVFSLSGCILKSFSGRLGFGMLGISMLGHWL